MRNYSEINSFFFFNFLFIFQKDEFVELLNEYIANYKNYWNDEQAWIVVSSGASPLMSTLIEGMRQFEVPVLIITPLLSETAKPWYIEVDRQSLSFVSGDYLLFDKLSNFLKFSFSPLFNLHHFNNESELNTDISTKTDLKYFCLYSIAVTALILKNT
jgi:hypothetical protein